MRPCWALAAMACAIGGCGAPVADAVDRSTPATAFDGGLVSEADAGPVPAADAGPAAAGIFLATDVVRKETGFDLLAVDRGGTAYAVSTDGGASWTVRYTFQGHRHGHGLAIDGVRNALWAFFGDSDAQSGAYRSTDGGATWKTVVAGDQDGDIVDAIVLPDGSLFCGQDISYVPPHPAIARIHLDGSVDHLFTLPSASYSTHAIAGGGYVVGATYEVNTDVSPPGRTSGSPAGTGE